MDEEMEGTGPRLYATADGTGIILTLARSGLDRTALRERLYAALDVYCAEHRMVPIREKYKREAGDAYLDVDLVSTGLRG